MFTLVIPQHYHYFQNQVLWLARPFQKEGPARFSMWLFLDSKKFRLSFDSRQNRTERVVVVRITIVVVRVERARIGPIVVVTTTLNPRVRGTFRRNSIDPHPLIINNKKIIRG